MIDYQILNTKSIDNKNLKIKIYRSENPVALVYFIHGIGEHIDRYNEWASYFTKKNISFVGFDLRGHGKSEGKRGHAKNYNLLMQDIKVVIEETVMEFDDLPKILYGHSLGGNLAMNYSIRNKDFFKCVIASSPWLKLAKQPGKFKFFAASILKYFYPSFLFHTGMKKEELTNNEAQFDKDEKDNLLHGKISISLFFAMQKAAEFIRNNPNKINTKSLLLYGKSDFISDYSVAKELKEKSKLIETELFDNMYHELHNDKNSKFVFNRIYSFIINNIKL